MGEFDRDVSLVALTKGYYAHRHRDDDGQRHTHGEGSHIYRHAHDGGCEPHEHVLGVAAEVLEGWVKER